MTWSNVGFTSLTIPTGATSGKRIVLANAATDDAIDIYDTNGNLIFQINDTGNTIWSDFGFLSPFTHFYDTEIIAGGNGLTVFSRTDLSQFLESFTTSNGVSTQASTALTTFNNSLGNVKVYALTMYAGSDDNSKGATATGTERNITGSLVQTDQISTNNLAHKARYSATVGASGLTTFNHGCSFTPTGGTFSPLTNFSQGNWTDSFGTHGFTSTQGQITALNPNGSVVISGATVTFYADLWG